MDDGTSSTSNRRVVARAMRSAVGREATTFGFSILVTVSFGWRSRPKGRRARRRASSSPSGQ